MRTGFRRQCTCPINDTCRCPICPIPYDLLLRVHRRNDQVIWWTDINLKRFELIIFKFKLTVVREKITIISFALQRRQAIAEIVVTKLLSQSPVKAQIVLYTALMD
jgi:hypothetical protein